VNGDVIMLTKNELLASLASRDAFILAIVRVQAGYAQMRFAAKRRSATLKSVRVTASATM